MVLNQNEEVDAILQWAQKKFPNSPIPNRELKSSIRKISICIDIFSFVIRTTDDAEMKNLLREINTVFMWLLFNLLNYSDTAYDSALRSTSEWVLRFFVNLTDENVGYAAVSNMSHRELWSTIKGNEYFVDINILNKINDLFGKSSNKMHRGVHSKGDVILFLDEILEPKTQKQLQTIRRDISCIYDIIVYFWKKEYPSSQHLTIAQRKSWQEIEASI